MSSTPLIYGQTRAYLAAVAIALAPWDSSLPRQLHVLYIFNYIPCKWKFVHCWIEVRGDNSWKTQIFYQMVEKREVGYIEPQLHSIWGLSPSTSHRLLKINTHDQNELKLNPNRGYLYWLEYANILCHETHKPRGERILLIHIYNP